MDVCVYLPRYFSAHWLHQLVKKITQTQNSQSITYNMKKTIALLLATATAAFAATKVDLEWNNNTAGLTGAGLSTSTGVTVAYTLNFANIQSEHFFYFLDEIGYGAGMGSDLEGTYVGAWGVHPEFGGAYDFNILDKDIDGLLTSGASYMSIVYSMQYADGKYHVREDLYMWDSVGELIGYDFATGDPTSSQLTFGNFKEININNSYVAADGIDVYSGTMSDDAERQAAALAVLGLNVGGDDSTDNEGDKGDNENGSEGGSSSETVPEPATATLSLLALAALAARRRRK